MEPVRVNLVTGIFPPDIGGPATFIPELADYLFDRGYKVKVLTLASQLKDSAPNFRYSISRTSRKIKFPLRVFFLLGKMMQSFQKTDSIVANGLYFESAIANVFTRKQLICKIVGDPVWERYRNATKSTIQLDEFCTLSLGLKWRIQRLILRWSLNRADLVVTPSPQLKSLIKTWGVKTDIKIIPNGTPCLKLSKNPDMIYDVVSVSRLVNWKNIEVLIEACALNNMSLAIAGSGPEEDRLKKAARKVNARVTFTGHLNQEESNKLMARSRIFALISSYEGMSFTLLEAMMLGMRILVSANQGNANVIESGKNGLVVSTIFPAEVAEYLRALNQSEANALGNQARQTAIEKYCLEKVLQSYEQLFSGEF